MIPVILKDISPRASLQEYVRKYQIFRFLFNKEIIPPAKFHAPRPEHCITFYIKDAQKFSVFNSKTILTYPQCVINGMYTVPILRYGGNDFWAIKVVLQPSILYRLIKFPLGELTNKFINAEDVWGKEVRSICEQLNELKDLDEMLMAIEMFFENLVKNITKHPHPIDKVTNYILNIQNGASLDWLANQSCLSVRQFIRKFEERIGISAKKFEQIIRFDKAYRMKNSHPNYDWLYIAIACDYHDYQHLVKDFKEFTNLTPPSFYELEKKSPERSFGFYES
ncbi:MAG: helix-turn-helix domain-containing protein [Chitinophagaceae bacterium]|nr:helix-turn-helix domain-containing protein [Chitinophagaceae bacterium]MDP1764834.1 helix-turn-helix domain-containing protein [Sediminibacterium sp.]MDP1810385.1 helix-turn-helix domain-containing protein [Sediminibacterium sp.]MDP3665307.1 helix-turn-helix domain-containing protein [Sediminibacterium sp.]